MKHAIPEGESSVTFRIEGEQKGVVIGLSPFKNQDLFYNCDDSTRWGFYRETGKRVIRYEIEDYADVSSLDSKTLTLLCDKTEGRLSIQVGDTKLGELAQDDLMKTENLYVWVRIDTMGTRVTLPHQSSPIADLTVIPEQTEDS